MSRLTQLPQVLARTASRSIRLVRARVVVTSWAWPQVRNATLTLALLLAAGTVVFVTQSGGLDPAAARLLRHDVVNWPGGHVFRRLALTIVALRAARPETLGPLVRMAHTVDPDDPLWPRVLDVTGDLLAVDVDQAQIATSLARIDATAATFLGRPVDARLGALGWWPLDEYFVYWLDDLAGDDVALALQRFNGILPPTGLPTGEWILSELAPALADTRAVRFVVVVDGNEQEWRPVAMREEDVPPGARRIDVRTVGEAVAVTLWSLEAYQPDDHATPVAQAWNRVAATRGLPRLPVR